MARQRILTLTEGQLAELQQQRIHHEHPRVRQRMDAVWLRANGITQLRAAEMLGITRHTIAGYENLYEAGGIDALKDCKWGSRVSPLQAYANDIEAFLEKQPPRTLEEACDLISFHTTRNTSRLTVLGVICHLQMDYDLPYVS